MSKIFRRPMFRGGSTNNKMSGIMSGIKDTPRRQYAEAGNVKSFEDLVTQSPRLGELKDYFSAATSGDAGQRKSDILSRLLIQGGLNLVSGTGAGKGTLGSVAESFKTPTETALTAYDRLKGEESGIKSAAVKQFLTEEMTSTAADRAEKLAAIKNQTKDFFASQTPEAQFEVLFKGYNESSIPAIKAGATNLAKFEVAMNQSDQPYSQLGFTYDKKSKGYVPGWANIPVGFITYNPQTNLAYKRVDRTTNTAADYIPLNPSTLQPLE